MDTWKGERLYGPDRRMTRAQLEECDREPTDEECLRVTSARSRTAESGHKCPSC